MVMNEKDKWLKPQGKPFWSGRVFPPYCDKKVLSFVLTVSFFFYQEFYDPRKTHKKGGRCISGDRCRFQVAGGKEKKLSGFLVLCSYLLLLTEFKENSMVDSSTDETRDINLGLRFQYFCSLLRLTIDDLSKETFATPDQLRNIENGKIDYYVLQSVLQQLEIKYGLNPEFILNDNCYMFLRKTRKVPDNFFKCNHDLFKAGELELGQNEMEMLKTKLINITLKNFELFREESEESKESKVVEMTQKEEIRENFIYEFQGISNYLDKLSWEITDNSVRNMLALGHFHLDNIITEIFYISGFWKFKPKEEKYKKVLRAVKEKGDKIKEFKPNSVNIHELQALIVGIHKQVKLTLHWCKIGSGKKKRKKGG